MSKCAIMYGDILGSQDRRELEDKYARCDATLQFMADPALPDDSSKVSHVIIDLDNPRFIEPQFLLAMAQTAGARALVGTTRNTELDVAHYAKLGVSEVISPDECLVRMHQLLDNLEKQVAPTQSDPVSSDLHAIVGSSAHMREIQDLVVALKEVDFPMALILGETGTGKSLLCKVLHNSGVRSDYNLVEVNCSSIPEELFESELFGHVRGAFTDAASDKQGLFEFAQNGTLFLDEIGNLSASAQAKLLKVLEDKQLRRLGDVANRQINVRVVVATNCDLEEAVSAGTFRQDLFYRLNLLSITVPPLRHHPDDIPDLAAHYLQFFGTTYSKSTLTLSEPACRKLMAYHWPGNVRELCNVIERAVLLNKSGVIEEGDLGVAINENRLTLSDRRRIEIEIPAQGITLREVEVEVAKHVLNMFDWNRTKAAAYLGISRPRLRRILDSALPEKDRR